MSEITLESQLFEIIKNKELSEDIKLAKVDMLIKLGVDVNTNDMDEKTALMFASCYGHKDIVELLVSNWADVNKKDNDGLTALTRASSLGYKEIVEILVSNGADVNQKDHDRWTALMFASFGGHKEIIEFLVSRGADINQKNNLGKTAIDLAKNEEVKGILNKKVQELAEEKNNSIFTKIKRGFGLGD